LHTTPGEGTYTEVRVAVQEDLTTPLPTDILSNVLELARRASLLDVDSLQCDLVRKQSRRVLPPPENERGICFLRIDDGLLDVVVNGRLDGAHEPRTHVDTTRSQGQRSSQTLTICEASRCDERHTKRLSSFTQQDEVGDVGLANMTGALEAIDGQKVNTKLDRGLCMPDGRALMQNGRTSSFQLLDHRPRAVSCRLHNVDLLLDYHVSVCGIIRRNHGGKEGQVNPEWVLGHGSASANLFAEVFGRGLRECGQLVSWSEAAWWREW
jgi:hypothetical protein